MSILKSVFNKSKSTEGSTPANALTPEETEATLKELKQSHIKLSEEARKLIQEIAYSGSERKWSVWEQDEGFLIEKTSVSLSQSVCGRATIEWDSEGKYDMDVVDDYLWDGDTKEEYDEHAEKMISLISHGDNITVMNQIFKGRFGLAGRDFIICCSKLRDETPECNRLIITAKSVPTEQEPIIEKVIKEESREAHAKSKAKNTRGTVFIAGFVVENPKGTTKYRAYYINDIGANIMGIPQWIITRVKLDQLMILKNIPENLIKKVEKAQADGSPK